MRKNPVFRSFADLYPAYLAAAGIFNISFLWLLNEHTSPLILTLCAVPGILAAWFLFGLRSALFRFLLPSLPVLYLICMMQNSADGDLPEGSAGGEIIAECLDPSLCGGKPSWLPNAPYHTIARLKAFRYSSSAPWIKSDAKIFLRIPRRMTSFRPGYGDLCCFTGFFDPLEDNSGNGGFNFANYARVRGIRTAFQIENGRIMKQGKSLSRMIYDMRGRALSMLGSGMKDESARKIASALFFGMKQGIRSETRNYFLRSGTIHILSVSGLHIGLFFSVFLILFRVFPYSIRWLAILLPVGIYAYSTGMQGPAFRAYVMLAVWCVLKACLRKTNALNTVALAGVILMIMNPAIPLDIGFQYSFLCVIVLIYSAGFLSDLKAALNSRWKYTLENRPSWIRKFFVMLTETAAVSCAAWLAGAGLSLLHQGLFSPYSVPAFLLISPIAWISFAVFAVSLLFGWIPGVLSFAGFLLQPLLLLIRGVTVLFGSSGFYYTARIPWIGVTILLILLFILLRTRSFRILTCSMILAVLSFGAVLAIPHFQRDELLVVSGGEGHPMLILSSARASHALIVNIPDHAGAGIAAYYLKSRGILCAETVFFNSMRKDSCGGAYYFLNECRAGTVVFPKRPAKNTFYALSAAHAAERAKIMISNFSSSIESRKEGNTVHFSCSGYWKGTELRMKELESGGFELQIAKGTFARKMILPLSAEKQIRYAAFP